MEHAKADFTANVDESVSRNLKLARERAGFSQAELARLMTEAGVPGMHQTTIARIESNQRTLRLAEALVMARILEYRVEDLVESDDSAELRTEYDSLTRAVAAFRSAGEDLLWTKQRIAIQLDLRFPYESTGVPDLSDYVKVNPMRYEILDELLSTNSNLAWLVDDLYRGIHDRLSSYPHGPFAPSRVMELMDEAIEYSLTLRFHDRTDSPDEEFEAKVLSQFEGGESVGEHQKAP